MSDLLTLIFNRIPVPQELRFHPDILDETEKIRKGFGIGDWVEYTEDLRGHFETLLKRLHFRGKPEKYIKLRDRIRDYASRFTRFLLRHESRPGKKPRKEDFLLLHDLLLLPYIRSGSDQVIESLIIGDTISAFLNLDPELKTGRCTAGNGIYKKVSLQYPFHPDIKTIDLCSKSPENKVAEVITVDTVDHEEREHLLVETAEAGPEAYLIPDYQSPFDFTVDAIRQLKFQLFSPPGDQGKDLEWWDPYCASPAWACLLLEEVVDRAYRSGVRLFFSTNIDTKPAPNQFLTTASRFLGLAKKLPKPKRYDSSYRGEVGWEEFLTTRRWQGHKESRLIYLEKKVKVDEDPSGTGLLPETYLGAWAIPENRRGGFADKIRSIFTHTGNHPHMNNGRGYVRGFVYDINEERYREFKERMEEVRARIGLQMGV